MSNRVTVPPMLASLFSEPVAIFGKGLSGEAAGRLLTGMGASFVFYDARKSGARAQFGPEEAARHRLAVVSPGFTVEHSWLEVANTAGIKIFSELDLAALCWRRGLIAVTGTNGKTTTTELLARAMRCDGEKAVACGNNGKPFSDLIVEGEADMAVCEVSSFQAEQLRVFAPQAVVWTNFSENHLDRHAGIKAYFAAKWNLLERASTDAIVVGESVAREARRLGYHLPSQTVIAHEAHPEDLDLAPPAGSVMEPFPARRNYAVAATLWRLLGRNEKRLKEAASTFSLPPHRMARLGEIDGTNCWNDSKSTTFASTLAALDAVGKGRIHWIGGGRSKGGDLAGFARAVAGRVEGATLIGETGLQLRDVLSDLGVKAVFAGDLPSAVERALAQSPPPNHLVFSPGFGSQDQFSGFAERGRAFEQAVFRLKPSLVPPK